MTLVESITQLLLAVIFMLCVSGLLSFLEFLSVDNSSLVFLFVFFFFLELQDVTHSSRGTYHSSWL